MQLGMAVSCFGGAWAELCRCQREEAEYLAPSAGSSRSGGQVVQAQGQGKEGGSPHAHVSSQRACTRTVFCGTAVLGQLTAGREVERLEPGGLSAGRRPAGHPRGRRRCLYLLVMESSSLSGLEGCSLQSS